MTRRREGVALLVALVAALTGAAPAHAALRASGTLERTGFLSLRLTVTNTGDEPFSVTRFTLRPGFAYGPPTSSAGTCTRGNTPTGSTVFCDPTVAPGQSLTVDFNVEPRYPDGSGGQLQVQRNLDDPGEHRSLVAGPGEPAVPPPVAGRSERVEPVSGTVLVRPRGSRTFVALRAGQLLPDGSEIDTRRGVARVVVAATRDGATTASALVSEGRAIIDQNQAARPTTTLRLSQPLACPRASRAAAAAKRKRKRKVFVETDGGRFRTRGNYGAAVASGTQWRTTDRCTSTRIDVREGTVKVRDRVRKRTVRVTAPGSYTARKG